MEEVAFTCMSSGDLETFRKSIGLTAVVDTGEAYELDTDVDGVDVDSALASVAMELGKVRRAVEYADALYRASRGVIAQSLITADPKMAEWKVREQINASAEFMAHKERKAELVEVQTVLEGFADALRSR